MPAQLNPNKMNVEGIYTQSAQAADEHNEYVHGIHAAYPTLNNAQFSAGGTVTISDVDELDPPLVLAKLFDWLLDVEEGLRTTADRIKHNSIVDGINGSEAVRSSIKQRLKYFLAMVGLVGIAVTFALGQLSQNITLPPVPNGTGYVEQAPKAVAPIQNDVAVAANSFKLSPVFSPEVQQWEAQIIQWAAEFDVDPNAVATIMQIESCGDPLAESYAGAQGLFQVMPFHFEANENMKDPTTNARRGIAYYKLGLEITGGDSGLAMAGYNGGHSITSKSQDQWAHETQRYYYWGTGIYADARAGLESSPRLQEWMQAGGASLCAQAASRVFPTMSN